LSQSHTELFADGSVEANRIKAEYGFSRAMAYKLMANGKLPFTRIGRKRLIPRRAIAAILAAGLVNADAAGK
jgi:excisionase family DNA binding protein